MYILQFIMIKRIKALMLRATVVQKLIREPSDKRDVIPAYRHAGFVGVFFFADPDELSDFGSLFLGKQKCLNHDL